MKRIFTVLSVFALLLTFAFTASAQERAVYLLTGEWYFDATVLSYFPDEYLEEDGTYWQEPVAFTISGQSDSTYIYIYYDKTDTASGIQLWYVSGSKWVLAYEEYRGWIDNSYRFITFKDTQTVNSQFYDWFLENARPLGANPRPDPEPEPEPPTTCDGSACPATDVNRDNVCDDCGLTFAVLRDYPAPDGWPADLPKPPAYYDTFTVFTEKDNTWLYMVDGDPYAFITLSDPKNNVYTLTFTIAGNYPQVNIQRYRLINGEWAYDSATSLRTFYADVETFDVKYSTINVMKADGTTFFPGPLWEVAIPEGLEGLKEIQKTMVSLALCGIGCIALLVLLILLKKRFWVFLGKQLNIFDTF